VKHLLPSILNIDGVKPSVEHLPFLALPSLYPLPIGIAI
jgi:hypothetical protein